MTPFFRESKILKCHPAFIISHLIISKETPAPIEMKLHFFLQKSENKDGTQADRVVWTWAWSVKLGVTFLKRKLPQKRRILAAAATYGNKTSYT